MKQLGKYEHRLDIADIKELLLIFTAMIVILWI